MKLFNGQVLIVNTPAEVAGATPAWTIECAFQSENGYTVSDIKIGDVLILKGYNIDTDEFQYCQYEVKNVQILGNGNVKLTINLAEDVIDGMIYAPSEDEQYNVGIIGRKTSENGFLGLPTVAQLDNVSFLQAARNIDLKNRDAVFTEYVLQEIEKAKQSGGGSGGTSGNVSATDDTKLPIAGGTITGNLTVENKTTLNELKISAGDTSVVVNADGVEVGINAKAVIDTKTVASVNDIKSSVSRVSNNGQASFTDSTSGKTAVKNEIVRANGNSTDEETISSTSSTAKKNINVQGNVAQANISVNGTNSADVTITADAESSNINLNAKKINMQGEVTAQNDVVVGGTVKANKLFDTSESETFDDNQLVTKKYTNGLIQSYVADVLKNYKEGGITKSEVEELLNPYALSSSVDAMITNALATIDPAVIQEDENHHFVTANMIATWNAKQNAIDTSVFEVASAKGTKNGYCPLDGKGKVPENYLDLSKFKVTDDLINVYFRKEFEAGLNYVDPETGVKGRIKGVLVFVVPDDTPTSGSLIEAKDWELYRVISAEQSDVDAGSATHVGDVIAIRFNIGTVAAQQAQESGVSVGGGSELGWHTYGESAIDGSDGVLMRYHGTPGITIDIKSTGATITVPKGGYYDYAVFFVDEGTFTKTQYKIVYDKNNAFTPKSDDYMLSPMPLLRMFDEAPTEKRTFTPSFNQDVAGGNYVTIAGSDVKANQAKWFVIQF